MYCTPHFLQESIIESKIDMYMHVVQREFRTYNSSSQAISSLKRELGKRVKQTIATAINNYRENNKKKYRTLKVK